MICPGLKSVLTVPTDHAEEPSDRSAQEMFQIADNQRSYTPSVIHVHTYTQSDLLLISQWLCTACYYFKYQSLGDPMYFLRVLWASCLCLALEDLFKECMLMM